MCHLHVHIMLTWKFVVIISDMIYGMFIGLANWFLFKEANIPLPYLFSWCLCQAKAHLHDTKLQRFANVFWYFDG